MKPFSLEGDRPLSPEQKLMLAMVKQARRDLIGKHRAILARSRVIEEALEGSRRRRLVRVRDLVIAWREARDFFLPSSRTSTLPIACGILDWDVDATREAAREWMNLPWNGRILQRLLDEAPK